MKRAIQLTLGCLIAAALSDAVVHAQFRNPYLNTVNQMNLAYNSQLGARSPYFYYGNQLQMMQGQAQQGSLYMGSWQSQALNNSIAAKVYGTDYGIPYNYSTVANYYSPYGAGYASSAANPYLYGGYGYGAGLANPYAPTAPGYGVGANTYAPGGAGDPSNPYNPLNPYNPYNPYNPAANPFNSTGASLMGAADVMRSYGKVINDQESARILREKALQEKENTRKLKFDTDMYIKANTPTYTQEQATVARNTLVRIQNFSLPGEVQNGKSLNYLLKDLSKYPNKKIAMEPINLSEAVLSHVNVTKNTFGLGVLRDEARITLPAAVQKQLTVDQRKALEEQLKGLVKEAYKGKLDANVLTDVSNEIERIRKDLLKQVNEIPYTQYMDAKRFLQEVDQATIALQRGEAPVQKKFQRFIEGGRSVQEVADYMIKEGLQFGPASADDEAAYRALHSAMASYDIAMNAFGDAKDQ